MKLNLVMNFFIFTFTEYTVCGLYCYEARLYVLHKWIFC